MPVAYRAILSDACSAATARALSRHITDGFRDAFGREPGSDEIRTWASTLPVALNVAASVLPDRAEVLVEYGLPFNDQRIDLMFLGGRQSRPAAHLIELKRWEASRTSATLDDFVDVAGNATPHPSYQVLSYAGKLAHLHSFGPHLLVSQSALIADGGPENHRDALGDRFAHLLRRAPLHVSPDVTGLEALLRENIQTPPEPNWVQAILNGRYRQSGRLLDMLKDHGDSIVARASDVLAVAGWGLSDDQKRVYEEIRAAIRSEERALFCVAGGPGSGKSLLALHLLLEAVGTHRQTVLAVRNNRLNVVLRKILSEDVPGAQGLVKYFSTAGRAGVEDGRERIADVLICDEAQRLSLRTDNVFRRAPSLVLFYDEDQILNDSERGTAARFRQDGAPLFTRSCFLRLPTPHRCRGGARYIRWVNVLLESPGRAADEMYRLRGGELLVAEPRTRDPGGDWTTDYELLIASSAEEVVAYLRARSSAWRVGLLASFTRASGKDHPKGPGDLGHVRVPEVDPPVRWLMDPQRDYLPFYLHGRSNDLDTCASIYGCQGFELDYAGLFWGNDLVVRGRRWTVGKPANCFDAAPGAERLATVMRRDPSSALRLLRNRYRILLTRGIFGTIVYCEDPETQAFLSSILRPS